MLVYQKVLFTATNESTTKEYEENGTPTYSLEPPDSELYDDIQITEKKEKLCIKKSYKQYKVIKEYLTLENKIKRYENLSKKIFQFLKEALIILCWIRLKALILPD